MWTSHNTLQIFSMIILGRCICFTSQCVRTQILINSSLEWCGCEQASFCEASPGRLAVLGDWQSSYRRCRKDEVVLCRAHIGHTHLTHSYILKKDPPPQCEHCQGILTVSHILVECNHLARTRNDIFGRCCVVESFKFHPELILKFLRDSEFYSKF